MAESRLQPKTFALTAGLRNGDDPLDIPENALTVAKDAYYKPNTGRIRRVPGRQIAGTPGVGPFQGIHHAKMDGDGVVLLNADGQWYDGDAKKSGMVFSTAFSEHGVTAFAKAPTDMVASGDRFYLFDGASTRNLVATKAITLDEPSGFRRLRKHGMKPVTEAPSLYMEASASGWHPGFLGDVTYWYLIVESYQVQRLSGDTGEVVEILDSAYEADPAPITFVGATSTNAIRVVFHAPANLGDFTHWKVYRSVETTASGDFNNPPDLSTFAHVATVLSTEESYLDDASSYADGYLFPTATAGSTWTNPNNAFSDNAVYTTFTAPDLAQVYRDFGFTATGAIVGIEVEFEAFASSPLLPPRIECSLSWDGGTSYSDAILSSPFTTALAKYVYPGANNLWGHAWTAAELSNANFRLRLVTRGAGFGGTGFVDYVKVRVYFKGIISQDQDLFYPTVLLDVAGVSTTLSRDGLPPVAGFGTMFEGSLVTNDIEDSAIIRWSEPTYQDSFPALYAMRFTPESRDEVTALAVQQDFLIVGMRHHIMRVRSLPSHDFSFSPERSLAEVTSSYGVVGHAAITSIMLRGRPPAVAFIDSVKGLCATDGFTCWELTYGLDWLGMVEGSALHLCQLIDYPSWSALLLYYPSKGSTTPDKRMIFHYHVEEDSGILRVTGPCHLPAGALACEAEFDGRIRHLIAVGTNRIYLEDEGLEPLGVSDYEFRVKTAEIVPIGVNLTANIERAFVHYNNASGGAATLTVIGTQHYAYEPDIRGEKILQTNAPRGWLALDSVTGDCESFDLEIISNDPASDIAIGPLTLSVHPHGVGEGS